MGIDPELIAALKGIETSLDYLTLWVFCILVFKGMGSETKIIYKDHPRRKP